MHTQRARRAGRRSERGHDRDKERLLPEDDPLLAALGISTRDGPGQAEPAGEVPPGRGVPPPASTPRSTDALDKGQLRRPTPEEPAAGRRPRLRQRLPHLRRPPLPHRRPRAARSRLTGVDVKEQSREHNTRRSPSELGIDADLRRRTTIADVDARRRPRTWCSRCTPATPPPTTRWRGRSSGRRPWCWPPPAATTTSPRSCAQAPTPAPYALLTRDGILRERFADTLTDALRAALLRLVGYRVDVVEFVESKHTPRNTLLRAVRTGAGAGDAGAGASTTTWSAAWRIQPRLAELLGATPCLVRPRRPAGRSRPGGAARAPPRRPRHGRTTGRGVPLRRTRRSSSRAAWSLRAGSCVTVNDSGDDARALRPSTRSPGQTVGGHRFGREPRSTSRRSRRPGGDEVWVGDIGDNDGERRSVSVTRVPVDGSPDASGAATSYELVYPDGRTTPRRCCATRDGRLYVVTKSVLGGDGLPRSQDARPDAGPTGSSRGRTRSAAYVTDGAFLPDGRHVVLRGYGRASGLHLPRASSSWATSPCPSQPQGEGLAVGADGRGLPQHRGDASRRPAGDRCPPPSGTPWRRPPRPPTASVELVAASPGSSADGDPAAEPAAKRPKPSEGRRPGSWWLVAGVVRLWARLGLAAVVVARVVVAWGTMRVTVVQGDITDAGGRRGRQRRQPADARRRRASTARSTGRGGPAVLEDCRRRFPDGLATGRGRAGRRRATCRPAGSSTWSAPNHRRGERDRAPAHLLLRRGARASPTSWARARSPSRWSRPASTAGRGRTRSTPPSTPCAPPTTQVEEARLVASYDRRRSCRFLWNQRNSAPAVATWREAAGPW